jgi:ankyrin repeat protein
VIGWATCWDECDDAAHRAVAEFLVSRGARHHIFSAIALDLASEVRRIVLQDPSALNRRMSRNENNQLPLHFAVRMHRPEMVSLLLQLGADPLASDAGGMPVAGYAEVPDADRAVMARIREIAFAERLSAERGQRPPRGTMVDLVALLALGDWETAAVFLDGNRALVEKGGAGGGALHLLAKRGDARAVEWLLERGANPNVRWPHWDADVAPLHLAASRGHADVVRLLLAAGADPGIRDSKHDSDALGWASFFEQPAIVRLLQEHAAGS